LTAARLRTNLAPLFQEAALDRSRIEALVHHVYAVRKMNNAVLAAELFASDAIFELAGSPGPGSISARVQDSDGMRAMMKSLVEAWEWIDHEILDLVIDGNRAAIRYRTKQRFIPTDQVVDTDLFDLVTFKDDKIFRMVEFCDTALATDMIQTAMQAAVRRGA
jgi:ketosteroid isomerase-like protein